jgi:general secretion pathway protein D
VVADEQTNSLLIEADQRQYDEIVEIIKKLDKRRPQVFIEAVIVEVSTTSALNFGFEIAALDTASDTWRGAGGTIWGLSTPKDNNFESLEKVPNLAMGGIAFLFREKFGRIPLLMQVFQADTDLNVLSTARILTNDNQKGVMKVTDQVPIFSTVDTQTGQSRTVMDRFEDAGITLDITPHISADDYLRLEINLLVEDFERGLSAAGSVPGKKSRSIVGTLTIPDKEIVVIGGLTSKKTNKVVNKITLLGDIPILGHLFRYTTDNEEKRNLYMFICPQIMRDERFEDLVRETGKHMSLAKKGGAQIDYMQMLLDKKWERHQDIQESDIFKKEIEPRLRELRPSFARDLPLPGIEEPRPEREEDDALPEPEKDEYWADEKKEE